LYQDHLIPSKNKKKNTKYLTKNFSYKSDEFISCSSNSRAICANVGAAIIADSSASPSTGG